MKKILILIFINIVLALLQTSFFPTMLGSKVLVNLVLAFGLSWLLVSAPLTALKSVFVGGIILDILLENRLGMSSLIMVVGVYALILFRSYLFRGLAPHLGVGTVLAYLYYWLVLGATFSFQTVAFSVLTSLTSIVLAYLLKQIVSSKN